MKQTAPNPFARLQSLGLGARAGLLILVVVMTYALVAPLAWWLGAWLGLAAAAVAAGVCLVGALIALIISNLFRDPIVALYGMLVSMVPRMGFPLGSALLLHQTGGPLAEAGAIYYLLGFYPVTLATETTLSLPQNATDRPRTTEEPPEKEDS